MFFAAREAVRRQVAERERKEAEAAKREANRISSLVSAEVTRQVGGEVTRQLNQQETLASARKEGRREERERIIRVLAQHGVQLTPELTISLIGETD